MQRVTALILTVLSLMPVLSFAQESVQDWAKKVIELQEREGQNFEQDLQLVKGFIYLQRRGEALSLLTRLSHSPSKKDSRIAELYETASDQFFFQDTAEIYADLVQFIKEESWLEAKEKTESGLQKEPKHRLLTLRAIQLALVLNQNDLIVENSKNADSYFSDSMIWKTYSAWINLSKNEPKEAYKTLSSMWISNKKLFENNELLMLGYLQSLELTKHVTDWVALAKIIQKHPEWVAVRVWRLKNKSFSPKDKSKEILQIKELFQDLKKLKSHREKEAKDGSYFYFGIISLEKTKAQFEELVK